MRSPNDIVNVLYGCEAAFKNVIGFCKYHHRFLTVNQLKQKQCLGKQCPLLRRIKSSLYWKQRELKKQKKKERICLTKK